MTDWRKIVWAIGAILAFGLGASLTLQWRSIDRTAKLQAVTVTNGADDFDPVRLLDPFPPITDIPIVPAAQAKGKVQDNELVLGVVVNGEARAYPINTLTGPRREILNDQLGNRAIAATW